MNITQHHLSLIAGRFRDVSKPKVTQTMLAEHMGLGKPWASKLLGGTMKTLSDDQVRKLEGFLGVRLRDVVTHSGDVSPLALEATRLMDGNAPLTKAIQAVLSLASVPVPAGPVSPSWIPTQEMSRVGQEVIRIAYANEDKPGKVARMVIELLSREAQKQTAKK